MTFFLIPNLTKEKAVTITQDIVRILKRFDAVILMEYQLPGCDARILSASKAFEYCDMIITIGGDGTMLHAARENFAFSKPMLGINLGRVGFLAAVEPEDLTDKLERLIAGDYVLDQRDALDVEIIGENTFRSTALNDIVISKSSISQTIDVEVFCDDISVNHYQGDGVIIATPTGSTAYSLSAGGPVLDARISGIVVTPICAHSLHAPSMVFSSARKLRVAIRGTAQVNAMISCDGRDETSISYTDSISVSLSSQHITLICFNEADQFEAIDKKLKGR